VRAPVTLCFFRTARHGMPAGSHGFLQIEGDNFTFEDGTPIKFWGTNHGNRGCAPDKETADFRRFSVRINSKCLNSPAFAIVTTHANGSRDSVTRNDPGGFAQKTMLSRSDPALKILHYSMVWRLNLCYNITWKMIADNSLCRHLSLFENYIRGRMASTGWRRAKLHVQDAGWPG
ncbi:unnamed protein product, partial [marine sediment metagenome]